MDLAVRAQELARINRSLTMKIRRTPAGLLDDDTQRRQVPRLRGPIERRLNRTLGDQHVLPEPSEGAAVARGVQQSPYFLDGFVVLAGSRARCEDHRVLQLLDIRNMDSLSVSIRALANPATISPLDSIPISVPNVGIPRENSSVPSIGSMIIRARPKVFAEFALTPPISSPSTSSAS